MVHDFVEHAVDALSIKPLLVDPSLNPTASGANERRQHGPAQGILKAEHHGVHV